MDFKNKLVSHITFGTGTIKDVNELYIIVNFAVGEKKFKFPDAFDIFINTNDIELKNYVSEVKALKSQNNTTVLPTVKSETVKANIYKINKIPTFKEKEYCRRNIAFKCIYCDGGKSKNQVGFYGVCSDKTIYNNIVTEHRTWCSSEDSPCQKYLNGEITRKELDELCDGEGYVCYESQMLKNWKAFAGIVQNGESKGTPMKLNHVQPNSLCVLTTRDPQSDESQRYIFAVFLVDDTYQGDSKEEGYVGTSSEFKLKLSPDEASSLLFWKYHSNSNNPNVPVWSSGLHRYVQDIEAAQILRDIAIIKKGTRDELLADKFYRHFCIIVGVIMDNIGHAKGALTACL